MDTCTLLAVGPVRLRAPLGGAVHLSHGVIQATADPWLGEGRLPLHPCSPAAGDAPAPRSPGTWLLNYVLCVASFRPCPASCLPSTPTSTGPLLPRMLTHRSPLVTCAVGLAAAWACAALGPQLLGLGRSDGSPPTEAACSRGWQAPRGRPRVQAAPPRVSTLARSCPGALRPVPARSPVTTGAYVPFSGFCNFPTPGPAQAVLHPPPPPGQQEQVAGLGAHLPEKSLLEPGGSWRRPHFLRTGASGVSGSHLAGDTWAPAKDPGGAWALATARSPKGSAPYGLGWLLTHTPWPVP